MYMQCRCLYLHAHGNVFELSILQSFIVSTGSTQYEGAWEGIC